MRNNGHKVALNINISIESFEFLDSKVKDKTFSSWSHGVDYALTRLKKESEEQ